jgi:hypothetical protein
MTFELADSDKNLISNSVFTLDGVEDIGKHGKVEIPFQFPPLIKTDTKSAKWKEIHNTVGFEPEYMYEGGNPRKIQVEAVYVVGGPGKWGITQVVEVIRTWKSYFYFTNFSSGGGAAAGKNLPIYRIVWGEFLPRVANNSAWRAKSYNVKYSDTWIIDGSDASGASQSHPLVSTVTVELELATQVQTNDKDKPKQPHPNLHMFAVPGWY